MQAIDSEITNLLTNDTIMFYAAINDYATEVSIGFHDTWRVVGFVNMETRDCFVSNARDLATRPCKVSEFAKYGASRKTVQPYNTDKDCNQRGTEFYRDGRKIT